MTASTSTTITHFKAETEAIAEVMCEQLDGQPERAQLFIAGMLFGLVVGGRILKGGSAEDALDEMETHLHAAIGKAYLSGAMAADGPSELLACTCGDSSAERDPYWKHSRDCPAGT